MATIINTPGNNDSGGAAGWLVGLIVLILVVLGAIFLLPRLTASNTAPAPQPTAETTVMPPVTSNTYNTVINASSTTNTGTTTH